jgi:hypothetical protein
MYRPLGLCLLIVAIVPSIAASISVTDYTCLLAFPPAELCRQPEDAIPFLVFACAGVALCFWIGFARLYRSIKSSSPRASDFRRGRLSPLLTSLLFLAMSWIFAWTRLPQLERWQGQSFIPLWFSFCAALNTFSLWRSGDCIARKAPVRYGLLFPLSAGFWWVFEYLNRFVQNWEYQLPVQYSAGEYFFWATLSFSTVLPALAGCSEALAVSLPRRTGWSTFPPLRQIQTKKFGYCALALGSMLLFLTPMYPGVLFPALWLAPPLVLHGTMLLVTQVTTFPEIARGDWTRLSHWMAAGAICGLCWETWNYYSLAKWVYHIPYLAGLYLFEMPFVGYLGYLPFGVLCAQVVAIVFPELLRAEPEQ